MIRFRIPRDPRIATKFFAQFTAADLARLALPLITAYIATPDGPVVWTAGFVVAAGVSAVLYLWRPYGKPLDVHAVNAARWYYGTDKVSGNDVVAEQRSEGSVITSSDYLVGFIAVTPTNLSMKTEPEQSAIHSIYQDMVETVSYPVTIHSRQEFAAEQTEYGRNIAERDVEPEQLKENYLDYWKKVCSDQPTTTRHYISLRVPRQQDGATGWLAEMLGGDDIDYRKGTAKAELDRRCREVVTALNAADLEAERVTGPRIADVARLFEDETPNPSHRFTATADTDKGYEVRHGAKDSYRQTFLLNEFPRSQRLGWPTELLSIDGRVEITQVVEPENPVEATKQLTRTIEKLSAEIDSWLRAGRLGTTDLEAKQDDADWMLNRVTDREDKVFTYRCYATVQASTDEECRQAAAQIRNVLDTMQIGYEEPVFRTHDAYKAVSPFYPDPHTDGHLLPGSSVAAGFPFSTQIPQDTTGVLYGEDPSSGRPIVLDRFNWSSHSVARMGMVGSGKSYASKLELMRSWLAYDDLQVIVVDPKQEYGDVVRVLGPDKGCIQTVADDAEYRFDHDTICFQVEDRGDRDDVDRLTDLVAQICQETSQDRRKTIVLIDEARLLLNDEDGREVLNRFVLEARDTKTGVTLVTQNASHFTHSREGREILDNMPAKLFMRHDRVPDSVVQYFNLSQREKQELFKLRTGTEAEYSECLAQVSDRVDTTAQVQATQTEHAIIKAADRGD